MLIFLTLIPFLHMSPSMGAKELPSRWIGMKSGYGGKMRCGVELNELT